VSFARQRPEDLAPTSELGRCAPSGTPPATHINAIESSAFPRHVARRLADAFRQANAEVGIDKPADDFLSATADFVASERRALAWQRLLLGFLCFAVVLATFSAFETGDLQWALCAVPLLVAGWLIARLTKRRKQIVADALFTEELYFGPHSPWKDDAPGV
jgi:hypothetical protein